MTIEFMHPLRLIALPVCSAVILGLCLLRRSRSRKERISHILRHVIILLTVLAIAGMSLLSASSDRTAFLLVDVSDSVNEEETLRLAREALENTGNRKTGVIAFGRNAAVERSLNQTSLLTELTARVDRSGSDLNSALQMASALLPTDSNGGIAVISDGRVTGEENFFSSAGGVPVNVLQTESRSGADAQVTSVSVPSSLYTGQKYTTMVTVHASEAGEAVLMLSRDRGEAQTRTVTLRKGENTFAFEAVAGKAGVSTMEAQVIMNGDSVSAHDTGAAYTVIAGEASVLIAEGRNGAGKALEQMLKAAGIDRSYEIVAVADGEAACGRADAIITITPATKPVIRRDWVRPGTHISCVGADMEGKQEIESALDAAARLYVDDRAQSVTSGELEVAVKEGAIAEADIVAELGEVIAGKAEGRTSDDQITVFDTSGIAVQDLASSKVAYERAVEAGLGTCAQL